MTTINNKSKLTLHIDIKLEDGSVADSTRVNDKPARVQMGSGDLSEAFEAQLLGLAAGETKEFTLQSDEAFGMPLDENIHVMERSRFPEKLYLKEGVIVEFEQAFSPPIPGLIRKIDGDSVTVDFNHPLCGQVLKMKVEVLGVD